MASKLQRSLSLPQLIFYGVGTIVGAGIYSVIGVVAGEAGNNLWISFVFAAIAAMITALSYAELTSTFPKAGAEYQFLKAAMPQWRIFAFMAGFLIALNTAATCATVSLAFGGYLNVFIDVPVSLIAFALLALCTVINIAGIRQSTWVSIFLICIEVSGLLAIIWFGFSNGDVARPFADVGSSFGSPGIYAATALVFFIYIGFEDIANLTEEAKDPTRNIPRALIISVIITSIIYILVAMSVIAILPAEELAKSDSPLVAVANTVGSSTGKMIGIAALFATASTALISLISISRMLFGMARDGDMPKLLSKILPKRKTPWVAALALFIAAILLLPLGKVKIVASISSFWVLTVFIAIQISVIILRYKKPRINRPFKTPFSIGKFPVLPFIGILISLALITQFDAIVYYVGFGAMLLGVVCYPLLMKINKS